MSPSRAFDQLPAAAGGAVLAATTGGLARLRGAAKPLHPLGELRAGRVRRSGSFPATGVAWLDDAGEDAVLVRRSRAVGLPHPLPDIHGLALRVDGPRGPADLLLASTGFGRLSRFVLTWSRDPRTRPLTTLLPYRTPTGPVLLGATLRDEDTVVLAWARPSGSWRRFATVHLEDAVEDPTISFDPLLHRLPGLDQYAAVVRLREPAYARARASRADP